jgi:hypothetical protein
VQDSVRQLAACLAEDIDSKALNHSLKITDSLKYQLPYRKHSETRKAPFEEEKSTRSFPSQPKSIGLPNI